MNSILINFIPQSGAACRQNDNNKVSLIGNQNTAAWKVGRHCFLSDTSTQ